MARPEFRETSVSRSLWRISPCRESTAARPPERLVSRGGDEIRVRHGAWVQAGGDQPCNVRDVRQQEGASFRAISPMRAKSISRG